MKREIKFRAFLNSKYYVKPCMLSWEELLEQYDAIDMFQSDFMTLMQFTCLKDKNGREIYEGDIVKVFSHGTFHGDMYEVTFDEKYATFDFILIGPEGDKRPYDNYSWPLECQVAGNKFENPELLEAEIQ